MDFVSGFVLAVVIAAILAAERLGGTGELARRFFQVALGIVLAMTVVSATAAFIRPDDDESGVLIGLGGSSSGDEAAEEIRDAADRDAAAAAVHVIVGVLGLVIGFASMTRRHTVPLGITFAGLLLIMSASTVTLTSQYRGLFGSDRAASDEMLLLVFISMLVGSVVLLWYGLSQWESLDVDDAKDEEDLSDDEPAAAQ